MKIESSKDNIIFIKADNQYELASTFLRMQEYYESPKFRNRYINLEEYMDWYAEEYGNFTYYSDWNGFNVPGDVVRKFFALHLEELLDKEQKLYHILEPWINKKEKFYVIGVWKEDTLSHEFSHAFYHVDPVYKREMELLLADVSEKFRKHCCGVLEKAGYHRAVFVDESIAYLATNTMPDSDDMFDMKVPWNSILPLQLAFEKQFNLYKNTKRHQKHTKKVD